MAVSGFLAGGADRARWRDAAGGLWSAALDVVFPPTCAACGRFCEHQICASCDESLKYIGDKVCGLCGRPTAHEVRRCRECRSRKLWFTRALSLWEYDGAARTLIKSLKYGNRRHLALDIAGRMQVVCARLGRFDTLTWVPMTPLKSRQRGYNQSELIALALAEQLGTDGVALLRKVRATQDQNRLDRAGRCVNNKGAFALKRSVYVEGKTVLLVDDVYTTGSTVADCARALKGGGAAEVKVITVARTVIEG